LPAILYRFIRPNIADGIRRRISRIALPHGTPSLKPECTDFGAPALTAVQSSHMPVNYVFFDRWPIKPHLRATPSTLEWSQEWAVDGDRALADARS
jgi:hypothetical protein